jgi:glutathione S-transferase
VQCLAILEPTFEVKDRDERIQLRKSLCEPGGAANEALKNVERIVAVQTFTWYCGEKATLADFYLFTWFSFVQSG